MDNQNISSGIEIPAQVFLAVLERIHQGVGAVKPPALLESSPSKMNIQTLRALSKAVGALAEVNIKEANKK